MLVLPLYCVKVDNYEKKTIKNYHVYVVLSPYTLLVLDLTLYFKFKFTVNARLMYP